MKWRRRNSKPLFVEHEYEGQTLIDAEAWCWGFWEGMELRPGSWDEIWDSEVAELMQPIYLLGADEIEEEELKLVEDPVKAHKLAQELEANLPAIYRFWVPRRKAGGANHEARRAESGPQRRLPLRQRQEVQEMLRRRAGSRVIPQ